MTNSNQEKAEHGAKAKQALKDLLAYYESRGYFKCCYPQFRIGMPGFLNNEQFYAPFAIEFDDKTKWIIYSTTSFRSDRIKENQWDAFNIKRIDDTVKEAFLIYPDSVSDKIKADFIRQRNKYDNREEVTEIDHILSQDEFNVFIEKNYLIGKDKGVIKDFQGREFESFLAKIISDKNNFLKWTTDAKTIDGLNFNTYKIVLDYLKPEKHNLEKVFATSDYLEIGKLPSGGSPKTDLIVYAKYYNEPALHTYTISCKRSSSDKVTVHEYSADKFADVLDRDNHRLRMLLNQFQLAGGKKAFGSENCNELQKELSPYIKKLFFWVMGGHFAEGTNVQKANYIVVFDNDTRQLSIHNLDEYYKLLKSSGTSGNFGTPFDWTYPSGKKGKKIQLKCKLLK